jgi:hypothetical protein
MERVGDEGKGGVLTAVGVPTIEERRLVALEATDESGSDGPAAVEEPVADGAPLEASDEGRV